MTGNYNTPQISLDYTQGGSYAGLDRFGRVLDQLWSQVGRSNPLDEYQYTYDPVGNQTVRKNMTDQSPPTAGLLDQSLGYYNCNRLWYNYNPATEKYPDAYAYDSSGNQIMSWAGIAYIPDRAVDAANELYFVAANGDYNQAAAQYDLAGNQISLEQGGEPAPSRPRSTTPGTGSSRLTTPAAIRSRRSPTMAPAAASPPRPTAAARSSSTTYYFHDGQQVIETELVNASGVYTGGYQYVWSPRYIDAPICRDTVGADGNLIAPTAGGRIYYLDDADYNVTSVVKYISGAWTVAEHYAYDPYGQVTVYNATWGYVGAGGSASAVGNTLFYTGHELDAATGLYYMRARYYDPALGRFISRDPSAY